MGLLITPWAAVPGFFIPKSAKALAVYGLIGGLEQSILAPISGQFPLGFGFTYETPWAGAPIDYSVGQPGQSTNLQWHAHLAGQRVFSGLPLRTHTTGIIDWAVRNDIWGAEDALELIHPGRVRLILQERETIMLDQSINGFNQVFVDRSHQNNQKYNLDDFGENVGVDGSWGDEGGVVDSECVSSAMGFSSPKAGSSGGIVNDYQTHSIRRI